MKKISAFLCALALMLVSFPVGADTIRGDVNLDGNVSISDVNALIDYLLNGSWPDEPVTPVDDDCVDLGLPSGTIWATRNIGATCPEDYGDYFAWGETKPKSDYTADNYKWWLIVYNMITKYCTDDRGYNGFTDGKTELDPEDDAAYVNWGPSWRMPSMEQVNELVEQCTWTWTTCNGVNGQLATGPNGNSIFLPATGYRWAGSFDNEGAYGYFWTRTLDPDCSVRAYYFCWKEMGADLGLDSRDTGFTVRAVRVSQD